MEAKEVKEFFERVAGDWGMRSAVKHAKCSRIGVAVEVGDGHVRGLVEDDEEGFDPELVEEATPSWGVSLGSMREGLYRIRLYIARMPERIELSPHAATEELEHRYKKAKDPVERSHLQIVWLLGEGKRTEEVSELTGYSLGWVRKIARRYNERGVEGLGDRRHSNPGAKQRALLDEAAEEELVEALRGPPPASVGGGMWSGPKVARWIERRNGLEKVHVQRGFEYLRKVGMSPQVPRPANAKGASPEEREAFKKTSR
jgi:transposase